MDNYILNIGDLHREVPYVLIGFRWMPIVELLGDVELTCTLADQLAPLIPSDTEVIFTTETSGVALGQALAERLKLPYSVARKRRRPFMQKPLIQEVEGMTLGIHETLWLDQRQADTLRNKKIILLSDVVVSGSTLSAQRRLAERVGCTVLGCFSAFVQGTPKIAVTAIHTLPS